jgi:hypothetical protein
VVEGGVSLTGVLTQIPIAFDQLHIGTFAWSRKMSVIAILRQGTEDRDKQGDYCDHERAISGNRDQPMLRCHFPIESVNPESSIRPPMARVAIETSRIVTHVAEVLLSIFNLRSL